MLRRNELCGRAGEGSRDDEMRSFPPPPPPPFLDERYCPTVDLDYATHAHTRTGFRTDFHDADTDGSAHTLAAAAGVLLHRGHLLNVKNNNNNNRIMNSNDILHVVVGR